MTSRSVLTGGRTPAIARDDWRSSDVVLEAVRAYGGGFIDTDPCASDDPAHHFAEVNITRAMDGLAREWTGLSYCNPEYKHALLWVKRCIEVSQLACSTGVILLLPARIGSRWYRLAAAHADAIAEWRGRITFVGAPHPAMFPTVLFGFNVSWRRFAAAFGPVADIVVPVGRVAP